MRDVSDDAEFAERLRQIATAAEDCEAHILDHWKVTHSFLLEFSLLRRARALIRPQFAGVVRTLGCTPWPAGDAVIVARQCRRTPARQRLPRRCAQLKAAKDLTEAGALQIIMQINSPARTGTRSHARG